MQFDLESAIIARYQGEARLQRLLWVATSSSDSGLTTEALQLAHQYAKEQGNLRRYKEVLHLQQVPVDINWANSQNDKNLTSRQVLQQRLQSAQSHLNKEAIRVAYQALASHDETAGNLNDAFHSVLRAKDYCTSRPQQATVSLHILQAALYLQNYKTVHDYTQKLVHTLPAAQDAVLRYKVYVAAGLERLAARDYVAAAQKLVDALYAAVEANHGSSSSGGGNNEGNAADTSDSSAMGTTSAGTTSSSSGSSTTASWNAVLAPEDVALFAAFLALAAMNSRASLLALAEHPEALELVPAAREAVLLAAKRADYAGSWKLLQESVFPWLELDLYMSLHLEVLKERVREKFLLQHWQAYQCVSLKTLQQKVGKGILPHPEKILTDLIQRGAFPSDTRLDLQCQTLVRVAETRSQQQPSKVKQVTGRILDDTYSMLIRLACVEEDLCVRDPNARKRRGHRFGGTAAAAYSGSVVLMDSDGEEQEDDEDVPMSDAVAAIDEMNPEDLY